MACIYIAINQINNKAYIGQAQHLTRRQNVHRSDANNGSPHLFHRAIRKYGWDCFHWRILYDDLDEAHLNVMEVQAIKAFQTKHPRGYNMTDGGEGQKGWTPTKEWRQKQSAAHKGKTKSAAHRRKLSKSLMGHAVSQDTRDKLRLATLAAWQDPEFRDRVLASIRSRTVSDETRRKMSKARKGKAKPAGFGAIVSKYHKGKILSAETRAKISRAHTGKKLSAEHKARISASLKRRRKAE